ncbi:ANTAR domain-containing protein [uncultured Jatrophihabitans sp.]|uniref:ANTAR domain-containing protein n=1 Tax=uncultured Jatrophihabitans sp. TaxID=1610747 RepID=UPI0035CAC5B1
MPSVEPSVVLGSLVAQCVPDFCDECSVEFVDSSADGPATRHRLSNPLPPAGSGGIDRVSLRAAGQTTHVVRVLLTIGAVEHAAGTRDGDASPTGLALEGEALFLWNRRAATRVDRLAAEALVARAVQLVGQQRSEQAAAAASCAVANLTTALQNSRQIGMAMGILMSALHLTQDDAFAALRIASQRSNRKLRDVASDVVETGWLDPAQLRK